jgi:hypothetical protein
MPSDTTSPPYPLLAGPLLESESVFASFRFVVTIGPSTWKLPIAVLSLEMKIIWKPQ